MHPKLGRIKSLSRELIEAVDSLKEFDPKDADSRIDVSWCSYCVTKLNHPGATVREVEALAIKHDGVCEKHPWRATEALLMQKHKQIDRMRTDEENMRKGYESKINERDGKIAKLEAELKEEKKATVFNVLNLWRDRVHALAVEKGWWSNDGDGYDGPTFVPEKLALIHSEVSEALEDYREGRFWMEPAYTQALDSVAGKPHGFAVELADVIIRVLDLAGKLGIDMDRVVREKHEYNATRAHRHGGKAC